jgi:CS domain/N-terminal conserved domain of Nudc.
MSDRFGKDDDRFDGLYLNVAHTTHGIEPLLDTVFSFLRRKTDFFAGPPGSGGGVQGVEAAVEKVNQVLRKHARIYEQEQGYDKQKTQKTRQPSKKSKESVSAKPSATSASTNTKAAEAKSKERDVIELSNGGFDISTSKPAATTTANKGEGSTSITESAASNVDYSSKQSATPSSDSVDDTKATTPSPTEPTQSTDTLAKDNTDTDSSKDETAKKPPVGNGATIEGKYTWTQTLSEVSVSIPVPFGTRGRDLNVVMTKQRLSVGLRSTPDTWIVNGPLCKSIICDDSFWTVEDNSQLVMTLQKSNQMEWWDCLCQGDPKINVQEIQPENSSLSDLDGEMRQTVEKMMYDQRQKAMGKPTSEEEEKLAMLEKFKLAHPELDFSNTKIN